MIPAPPSARADAAAAPTSPTRGAAPLLLPATAVVVAAAALVAALVLAGDDGHGALATGRPFARLVLALAAAATLGLLAGAAAERRADRRARLLDAAAVAAGVQTAATGATAFLLHLGSAPDVTAPSFGPGLVAFLLELGVGRTWLVATAAAAVGTAVVVAVRSRRGALVALGLALLALVPVALLSGAAGDPVAVARTAAVAAWLALAGVGAAIGVLVVARDPRAVRVAAVSAGVGLVGAASTAALRPGAPLPVLVAAAVLLGGVLAAAAALPRASGAVRTAARAGAVVLLAAAVGLGATPALTDPVRAAVPARTTPAALLTGAPLPPAPDAWRFLVGLRPDPLWLVVCLGLAVGAAVVGARSAGAAGASRAGRGLAWGAGVLLLLWATCGGPALYADLLLPALVVQRVLLLLVVPLLLAAAAPVRALAAARLPRAAGLLAAVRDRVDPAVALLAAAAAVLALTATDLLRWTLVDPVGAEVALVVPLGAGLLLVGPVLGGRAGRRRAVLAAAGTLVLAVAGAVALLAGRGLLQADWYGALGWGTDALAAQRTAGAVGGVVAVAAALVLLAVALRRDRSRPARSALLHRPGAAA